MKSIALAIAAVAFTGAAYAQSTTVITREAPASESTTVVKRDPIDGTTVTRKVESTGSLGCDTKSVTKTNDDGDRVTKTKTEC